ncbi:Arabinanase/levansucrase/invertase [Mycena vulgaris]|nr:Arabinanase/levansucrase/invertase [Mycena vulgaris]
MLKVVVFLFVLASQVLSGVGFSNPIKSPNGSHPFMVFHEGFYYLTTTTWTNIQITRAMTITGLKTAVPKIVWTDSTASRCCNVWAPGWKAAEGAWFIYYVAGTSGTFDNQHIHALRASSNIIWDSTCTSCTLASMEPVSTSVLTYSAGSDTLRAFSVLGSISDTWNSQFTSATSVGNAVKISTPTNTWETISGPVNEGPAALYHGGFTWIIFSASSCAGTGYELGQLTLTGTNPLSASSWTKNANPVFANGCPGHNGFFLSPCKRQQYLVYHASKTSPALCDGSRYTMVQQVNWHTDGSSNLGVPRALTDSVPELV